MPTNHAFWRSLNALAHPISIVAVITLLFNDHWLRWNYPSWLTGKLGDFTWLIFAPFVAGLFFAWLIPRRIRQHERIVGIVSIIVIGLWFALAKTIPLVHSLTTTAWESIIGWQGTLRMDATDLLTLPALLVSWWIWNRVPNSALNLRPIGYVMFGLAIVGTLANSPPSTDFGIRCVLQNDQRLFAISLDGYYVHGIFSSNDGGLSWDNELDEPKSQRGLSCRNHLGKTGSFEFIYPSDANIRYRFQQALSIEKSTDGGQMWTLEYDLSEFGQDIRRHGLEQRQKYLGTFIVINPGPFHALIDKPTGNLVVAMGHDGVLVRTNDGQWQWVRVGPYAYLERDDYPRFSIELMAYEIGLAVVFGLLMWMTLIKNRPPDDLAIMGIGILWLFWAVCVEGAPYKWNSTGFLDIRYFSIFLLLFVGSISLIFVVRTLANIVQHKVERRKLMRILILIFASMLIFFFPYILWIQGTIPAYYVATRFALLLAILCAFAANQYLKRLYPIQDKEAVNS
ncbi:MAG: hypothetical protein K8L97_28415 [Anaerolineae bacterium]|nr:hypothetical protein [Anaerolineae bacterium]